MTRTGRRSVLRFFADRTAKKWPLSGQQKGGVEEDWKSGGHTQLGQICGDVNRYLKWAFIEAGNMVVVHQKHLPGEHVVRLYQRLKRKKNHQKAVVAVARHLAEAAYWMLKKQEVYRSPRAHPKAGQGAVCASSFADARVSAEPAIAR
jgi:hypothetical protein